MPSSCTAAIFKTPNRPLELTKLPLPDLGPGEALLRVECCTICGSDLHSICGRRSCKANTILGHEIVGRIKQHHEMGLQDVTGAPVSVGQRVTFSIVVACGQCQRCHNGFPQKCEKLFKYGHEPGCAENVLGGGLAEFIRLRRGTEIVGIDDDLPLPLAATINCVGATAMAGIRAAGEVKDKNVTVIGAGMLGLWISAVALDQGARLVVVDPQPSRILVAQHLGHAFSGQVETHSELVAAGSKYKSDIIFETSGHSKEIATCVDRLNIGGRLILLGSVWPSGSVAVEPQRIVRGLLQMIGVHNYIPNDLRSAAMFLQRHKKIFTAVFSDIGSYPLTQINEAIEAAKQLRYLRVAVMP